MEKEVLREDWVEDKQFILKLGSGFSTSLHLDRFLPHAKKLPALELLEKGKLLDMVVRITFDKPLAQANELHWVVVLINR